MRSFPDRLDSLAEHPSIQEEEVVGLTECLDCGGKVCTQANSCPHCGRPARMSPQPSSQVASPPATTRKNRVGLWIGISFVLAIIFIVTRSETREGVR